MGKSLKTALSMLISIPKIIYLNFKLFNVRTALRFPIIVSWNTKLHVWGGKRGNVELRNWDKPYHVFYGFGGSEHIISNKYGLIQIGEKGQVIFHGKANFSEGCSLRCDYGRISFGNEFSANKNCCINCELDMEFGDKVLFGWNVTVRDTDGHAVFENQERKISQKRVRVGNHVWVCSYSDLLKGSAIGNDCVVAWRSCVLNSIAQNNVLIGGSPAKVLRTNIDWEK